MIRRARPEDYDAIDLLVKSLDHLHASALPGIFRQVDGPSRSQEWFANVVVAEDIAMFVAEREGLLAGLVLCRLQHSPSYPLFVPRRVAHVHDLVVREDLRGQGIGRLLMERVHVWAREQGIRDIELEVYEFNDVARALYERLGYETLRRTLRLGLPEEAPPS